MSAKHLATRLVSYPTFLASAWAAIVSSTYLGLTYFLLVLCPCSPGWLQFPRFAQDDLEPLFLLSPLLQCWDDRHGFFWGAWGWGAED